MPKKAHTEEQIVAVLRQGEAGEKVADICRKVGISEGTYYLWKKQYAGLVVCDEGWGNGPSKRTRSGSDERPG